MKNMLVIFLLFFTVTFITAQEKQEEHSVVEFSTGVDFVSGFVWRGINFGHSPAIQPNAAISAFGFELSAFGSYALVANEDRGFDKVPYTEFDLELKYTISTKSGAAFSIIASDIFMPYLGLEYSNYKGVVDGIEEGAHWLSAGIEYKGSESFPLSIRLDYHFYNDVTRSIYGELGYSFTCGETAIDLFFGAAMGTNSDITGSIFYEVMGESNIGITNVGGTISRTIKVTDSFSIPLSTSVVFNPNANTPYLVLSLSL